MPDLQSERELTWVFLCYAIGVKKPAGSAEEIEKHFGCESSQLIMVDENKKILDLFILFLS